MTPIEIAMMAFLDERFGGDHLIGRRVYLGCDEWDQPARHPSGFAHRHVYSKGPCRCLRG